MVRSMDMKRKTTRKTHWRVFGLFFLLLSFAIVSQAQLEQIPGLSAEGKVANYRFADQGELPITVCLVGAVRLPGRYEISRSIDLLNLLALAGGWTELADLRDVRINRLPGTGDQNVRKYFKLDLTDFQEVARTSLTLQHGDYIYIGARSGITAGEVLSYVTTAAILVTAYITVLDHVKK
jgi:hypothetical protein